MAVTTPKRILVCVLIGLAASGLLFRSLIEAKWEDGTLPFGPSRATPAASTAQVGMAIDITRESATVGWPAREGEPPAPAMSLRVAPTQWYGWWSTPGDHHRFTPTTAGPERVMLDLTIPNADTVPPDALAPVCDRDVSGPAACRAARARMSVMRDHTDWSRFDVVRGTRAPAAMTRVAGDGETRATVSTLWTKRDREAGRRRVLGWACPGGPDDLPLGPANGSRPEVLYRCFEPTGTLERRWPGLFDYEQHRLYFDCSAQDRCEILFTMDGRLVVLEFTDLPAPREREAARLRLFLSAWDTLERMRAEATQAPPVDAELAEARAQLAVCDALPGPAAGGARRDLGQLPLYCMRAARIACALATVAPQEAEPLLARAVSGLVRAGHIPPDAEEMFSAWFATIDRLGQGTSAHALEAVLAYLRAMPRRAEGDPRVATRRERTSAARDLMRTLGPRLPQGLRAEAYRVLATELREMQQPLEVVSLLREQVEALAGQTGDTSDALLDPLRELGWSQWHADDLPGLRLTLGRLTTLWLSQPEPARVTDDRAVRTRYAETGVDIVYLWRSIAFRDGNFTETAAMTGTVVERLRGRLGVSDAYVRAAAFHRQEVTDRRAVDGAPIGGGYLTGR